MILQLKYFGMIAEAVGKSEEQLEFTGNTVQELAVVLKESYPKLSELNYKFALNQTLVEQKEEISENDEIALLPPFAGG